MVGINNITLLGRLTKDPEEKAWSNKRYVTFTLAVERPLVNPSDREAKPKVDFIPCVCFNTSTADFMARNGAAGALCGVIGRMSYETKKDQEGRYHVNSSVVANNVLLYEFKKKDNEARDMDAVMEYAVKAKDSLDVDDPNSDSYLPF